MLKVLSIAHPAVSRATGRLRYEPLADHANLDVHLLVPRRWHEFGRWIDADPPAERGVTMHVQPVRWPRLPAVQWYLHHYPGLPRLMRELRPDVVHLWEESWSLVALQVAWLRRHSPRTAIVLEVDQNILKRLPPPFEAMRRHVLRQTDHILARSPEALQVVRACGYRGGFDYLGYGVDQGVFRPQDRAAARAEFGLDGLVIGYVGRLVAEKGLDDLLQAMALAKAPWQLAIMGEGPHESALRSAVQRLGLQQRVRFRPRGAPQLVSRFINAMDVLALLTRTTTQVREQFGRVIIEAHACGVPVIGSACGAIPSVVDQGGWVVPESDPPALARLLDRLAAEPGLMPLAGSRGAGQVQRHYTLDRMAGVLAESWTKAAAIRAAAPAIRPEKMNARSSLLTNWTRGSL